MKIILLIILMLTNLVYGLYTEATKKKIKLRLSRKSKQIDLANILVFMLLSFFVFLVITNQDIPDYKTYEWLYDTQSNSIEIGYVFIENIAQKVGLSFSGFRVGVFLISYFLIYRGLKNMNVNMNITLALYSIYPLTLDIIQFRNFLAIAIVIFALHNLMYTDKKRRYKFIFLVIMAGTIHRIAFIYLLLLLANYKVNSKERKMIIIILWILMIFSIIYMKVVGTNTLIKNILYLIDSQKAEFYTAKNINWGFLLYLIMDFGYVIIWRTIYYSKQSLNIEGVNKITLLYWMNLVILLAFPLCLININFYRIFRNLSLLNYCVLPYIVANKYVKNKMILLTIFIATFCLNFTIDILGNFKDLFLIFFN